MAFVAYFYIKYVNIHDKSDTILSDLFLSKFADNPKY